MSEFTVQTTIPWDILESQVRSTALLGFRDGEQVYPYEQAQISLTDVGYETTQPTSFYVIRKQLAKIVCINTNVYEQSGFDVLDLECGLVISEDGNEPVGLVPPIVEQSKEDGSYILDGAHRTSIGRWLGRDSFKAIVVSGFRSDCPAYAYPNSWEQIKVLDRVPVHPRDKKHYRDNYRSLYRDFSTLNGSKLREAVS